MRIKKSTKQPQANASLDHRLNAYSRQANQYQQNPIGAKSQLANLFDWKKTSLAALIPLAAASAVQAQCNGALAPFAVSSGASGNPSVVSFDVDGLPGNDLKVRVVSAAYDWFIAPANPLFYIGLSGGGRANGVGGGVNITRGQAFGNGSRVMCQGGGAGNFCVSSGNTITKSIPIRKGNATTGQPGWVTLQVANNYPTVTVTVLQRGLEAPGGDNSAITGDCTSLMAPLPVELTRFNAEPNEKNISLAWATASEINNSGFEVQRSTDGRSFSKIGWVEGSGTTTIGKEYAFTDNEVKPNTLYYYRLRQLDNNGTVEFTPIRSALVKDQTRLMVTQLFPNPINQLQGSANFQVESPAADEIDIQVFDARGGLVQQQAQAILEGENAITIPISGLASGVYFVKMQLQTEASYQRLTVED